MDSGDWNSLQLSEGHAADVLLHWQLPRPEARTADGFSVHHSHRVQSHPSSQIPGIKNIVVGDEERISNLFSAGQDSHKSVADATGAYEDATYPVIRGPKMPSEAHFYRVLEGINRPLASTIMVDSC